MIFSLYFEVYIVIYLGSVTIDRVWIGELNLLTTCTHHSELYFTDH
jgi:hypothetical protein